MNNVLFKNITVVNEGNSYTTDLRVLNGRIDLISESIAARNDEIVIEGDGKYLVPGMIDDQVHFREPGMENKADIATESRAAAAGGITSFMDMPNSNPTTTTLQALENKYDLANGKAFINYAFYLGATNDNIEEIRRLDSRQTCGIKIFMGASTGNMLVDRISTLESIFADSPVLIATHCEDTPTIIKNTKIAEARFGKEIPFDYHPVIRSEEACYLSSSLAVSLAKSHDANLHVLHITTKKELDLFTQGPIEGKKITAEACVHFLHFSDEDYATKGSLIKCNPAIKSVQDREGIITALSDGRIDILATDHAPHLIKEKEQLYSQAPSGLPLVQRAMQIGLDLVKQDKITLEQLVRITAHNPAIRYQIKERGFIREGYHADLVLLDLNSTELDIPQTVLYKCGWSPFDGHTFNSRIAGTWVNGYQLWDGQALIEQDTRGQRLEYVR